MTDVLVIGAGPTGLTAAAEAVRHGLTVRIVDANARRSIHSKALVLHSRSLEIFTDMGFVDQVLESGQEFRALNVYSEGKPLSRINFRTIDWQDAIYPFWLSLPQSETERCLEEHLARQGVTVERLTKLTDLKQDDDHVQATLSHYSETAELVSEETIEAAWLIGCDGSRSATRKLSDIPFTGTADDSVFILGDVAIDWDKAEDEGYSFMASEGILLVVPLPEPKRYRIIAHMPKLSEEENIEINLDSLQALMDERTGMISSVSDLVWSSSFSVKHLVAEHHRKGRVFLAGDAAHIHSPVGGQGLNTGIQDAYNLMWKLALVQQGSGTEELLNSYELERHEVAEATIKQVSLATKLVTLKNPVSKTLRNHLAAIVINTDVVQKRFGRDVGMLDINYRASTVIKEEGPKVNPVERVRNAIGDTGSFHSGPNSGERCPNVLFLDEKGNAHSLINYLYGTQHTLLLFAGVNETKPSETLQNILAILEQNYAQSIRSYLVTSVITATSVWQGKTIVTKDAALHRRFGATNEALYLVRPDNHIAYRSQPVNEKAFFSYLGHVFNSAS